MPTFNPTVQYYQVDVTRGTSAVPISVTSADKRCRVQITTPDGKVHIGGSSFSYDVEIPQNKEIDEGVPPIWEVEAQVQVLPPEGDKEAELTAQVTIYSIIISIQVSDYAYLSDLSVGHTPCKLEPKFDPKHYDYSCVFDWQDTKYALLSADIDPKKCRDCSLHVPNPKTVVNGHKHLNVHFQHVHKSEWEIGKIWSKYLIYGEYHYVPFLVVSQDRFTSRQYNIYIERACPWWMRASFTRAISKTATVTAALMSVASAGNLMALAKQIQFMDLTADIKGCPKVYADYTQSMTGFNLDLGWLVPDALGGMGPAAM